eukprot:TRINITY_DN1422_c0_g1_i2.p1 TRINITY_DN1422_c0_g1~~TRINITY_DN1422_c0_g1_i2.p1  ORF type:complete len:100 (+),score=5.06 TRINITY_DN1422_c0_g1_i2:336-635(+)
MNKLPTVDMLRRRGMQINNFCYLCNVEDKSSAHLFIHCTKAQAIWSSFLSVFNINSCQPNNVSELLISWEADFFVISSILFGSIFLMLFVGRYGSVETK